MEVIDEITGKRLEKYESYIVVVDHLPNQLIFGYVGIEHKIIEVNFYINDFMFTYSAAYEKVKDFIFYSPYFGRYVSKINLSDSNIIEYKYRLGRGAFPYSFDRNYEAIENFHIFEDNEEVLNIEHFKLSEHSKYTFGLEFETSMGYISEEDCKRDGLIPLRDGSISGLEYSTIVLFGDKGISLLKQQLTTLRKYTSFNKECSLHIHVGNFILTPEVIFKVYQLWKKLESNFEQILPMYTFKTHKYKNNEKDYCNKLQNYASFEHMYYDLTGRKYFGSLNQGHPNDIRREAKWRINNRYYAVNFINALCYNVNKTVEFRFLRPTYNFKKILFWLYIFNALIKYCDEDNEISSIHSIHDLIVAVYPEDIGKVIIEGIKRMEVLTSNQYNNNDYCGEDLTFEDIIFGEDFEIN